MPAFASINDVTALPECWNAVYTTICTLLKQISRMAAGTAAATGHGLRKDDGIATSQKRRKPPMKTKSSRFDSITRFSFVMIAATRFPRAVREQSLCDCRLEFSGEKTNISSGFRVCKKDSEDAAAVSCPASSRSHRTRNHRRAHIR